MQYTGNLRKMSPVKPVLSHFIMDHMKIPQKSVMYLVDKISKGPQRWQIDNHFFSDSTALKGQ